MKNATQSVCSQFDGMGRSWRPPGFLIVCFRVCAVASSFLFFFTPQHISQTKLTSNNSLLQFQKYKADLYLTACVDRLSFRILKQESSGTYFLLTG